MIDRTDTGAARQTVERTMDEREDRFRIIDEIRARMPPVPEREAESDIAEALAAARKQDAPGGD